LFALVYAEKAKRIASPVCSIRQTSPSLDKIDPEKGYVKGNVMWMSQLANAMKNNATKEELKQFANWVLKE
jgi:hypothetical protein